MIHTDEDDEFERIANEAKMKGQPYYFTKRKDDDDDIQEYVRPWVGLTEFDYSLINQLCKSPLEAAEYTEHLLKEKNA